ncbi:MAG: glycosyltransferase family 1 protein [Desulfobacteraceae bacterium]|nr:glycosyltransferase family 1 protein [Desulfobacteraceae bacterium]
MSAPAIAILSIHSSPVGKLGTRDTGGMSVFLCETSKILGKQGYCIDLFTMADDADDPFITPLFENVRLIRLPRLSGVKITKENLFGHLPFVFEAYKDFIRVQGIKYNLIHSHYWLSAVLGQQISKQWQIPHIVTFHTLGAIKNQACKNESEPELRIKTEEKLARLCNHIIGFTNKEKQELAAHYQADTKKIHIVPCGTNFNRFKIHDKKDARKKLNLNSKDSVLLFAGRHVPIKGLDRLLSAVSLLKQQKNICLVVVGGDDPSSKALIALKQTINKLGIKDQVHLAGRVNQDTLALYYSSADMLVVPSFHESFCLTALEALACGIPVLGSKVGGLADMITRETGTLLKTIDDQLLAQAIMEIINKDKKILTPLKIRESVKDFNWEKTVEGMLKIYDKTLKI